MKERKQKKYREKEALVGHLQCVLTHIKHLYLAIIVTFLTFK